MTSLNLEILKSTIEIGLKLKTNHHDKKVKLKFPIVNSHVQVCKRLQQDLHVKYTSFTLHV